MRLLITESDVLWACDYVIQKAKSIFCGKNAPRGRVELRRLLMIMLENHYKDWSL